MPRPLPPLSRRERQIMDILYARRQASAAEVRQAMPDPPSYSAVRAMLRVMEEKGHLQHTESGAKFIYTPRTPHAAAAKSALKRVLETFFAGSVERALATHLTDPQTKLSPAQLRDLAKLIRDAKKRGD